MKALPYIAVLSLLLLDARAEEAKPASDDPVRSVLKLTDLKQVAQDHPEVEVYRLVVSRAFHPYLVFQVDVHDGAGGALFTKKVRFATNADFSSTPRLVRDSRLSVENHEVQAFLTILDAAGFWELPEEDWQPMALDGSGWRLEAAKKGRYHKVVRSNLFTSLEALRADDELRRIGPKRSFLEGRLAAAFIYLWTLAGEATEELY